MIMMCRRIFILPFLLSLGWGDASNADGFDCDNTTAGIEMAICNSTELSALAALADVLGTVVGLDVRYPETSVLEDVGMSNGVRRLLSTLTFYEIDPLINASQHLTWDFVFDDQNKILFINAKNDYLQDGLVVFDPSAIGSSTPIYTEMEYVFDAARERYRSVGNILEITSRARPSEFTEKYRYQDGCWRLIGEDTTWADYMVEFNDDLAAFSVNHLTGRAIFDFKKEKGVLRTFDPHVRCLHERPTYHEIEYHDADG